MEKKIIGNLGFILDTEHHKKNKWVSAGTHFLVEEIIKEFKPVIINSQEKYEQNKHKIDKIFSLEPGWGAPKINYSDAKNKTIGILVSDPHNKKDWLEKYVDDNNINYVFSYYKSPFFRHFPSFNKNKFVHFPWFIPNQKINQIKIDKPQGKVSIFGGKNSDAYDFRNWCRRQKHVTNYENSGVENKKMSDDEYYLWLRTQECIIAAGSSKSKYGLVTPKYFEIPSAGALLMCQFCQDLKELGFNSNNCIFFKNRIDFKQKIKKYIKNPEEYIEKRLLGFELIKNKHTLKNRIGLIKKIYAENTP